MIKTLRITSFIAVILAVGFLAFPFIFGIRADPKAEEFLKSAGAVEKFSKTKTQAPKSDAQLSPLVKQAQAFALHLNPPKPEPQPEDSDGESVIRPPVITPKFTLIGTSISPNKPEKSLALIDEPGTGLHWVKQGSLVGHLTIKEIKNGVVVVGDGPSTSEIVAERPEKISLLRNPPPGQTQAASSEAAVAPAPPEEAAPQMPEREAPIEQISKELEAIEQQVSAGTLDPNEAAEKSAAIMEKYMTEAETARSRITSEEAQSIDRLGSQLQAKRDGNVAAAPVPQPPKKQDITPKPETKSTDTTKTKTVPRQRSVRRRGIRQRQNPPAPTQEKPATPP